MSSGISSIGLKFQVSSVTKTSNVDVLLNIMKRREELSFKSSVDAAAANAGFIVGDQVSSTDSVSIADRSTSLVGNRIRESNYTAFSGVSSFDTNTDEILITNQFTDEKNTVTPIPLFYRHSLSSTHVPRDSDGTLSSGVEVMSVKILDHLLVEQKISEFKIDYTYGYVFTNLETDYTNPTDWTVYYVEYKVKNGTSIDTYIDLLDNQSHFKVATFDDLSELMTLLPTATAYLIEEDLSGFSVSVPVIGNYAYRQTTDSRIKINLPDSSSLYEPWYVSVRNGKFYSRISGTLYKYYVAEFLSQSFYPESPYKISRDETSSIVQNNLIKTGYKNLAQDSDLSMFINLLISDSSGTALAAYTTDPSVTGTTASNGKTYQTWDKISRKGIRSIDHSGGFIEVEGITLKSTDVITSTYYYEEREYQFVSINVNPIGNSAILDQTLVLFLDPEEPGSAKTQTLYYLLIDEDGKCITSNWSSFDNSTGLLTNGKTLYYESVPSYLSSPPSYEIFTSTYSIEGSGLYLILGDVTVDEGARIENLSFIDSRKRGGGIREDRYDEALVLNPELVWHWDDGNWDGVPYRGNASYLVEVPVDSLDGAGGSFHQSQITDIILRHTALGVYPAIKGYGPDLTISGIAPGATTVGFSWESHGFDTTETLKYNIYSSISEDGPWDLASGSPVTHTVSGHSFTISGLAENTIHYFTVVPGYESGSTFIPLVTQSIGPVYEDAGGTAFSEKYKFKTFSANVITSASIGLKFEVI